MDDKEVNRRIALYRKMANLTQTEVAEKMGMPPQVLGQILNENRKIEVTEYCELCMALGIDISELAIKAGIYKTKEKEAAAVEA